MRCSLNAFHGLCTRPGAAILLQRGGTCLIGVFHMAFPCFLGPSPTKFKKNHPFYSNFMSDPSIEAFHICPVSKLNGLPVRIDLLASCLFRASVIHRHVLGPFSLQRSACTWSIALVEAGHPAGCQWEIPFSFFTNNNCVHFGELKDGFSNDG